MYYCSVINVASFLNDKIGKEKQSNLIALQLFCNGFISLSVFEFTSSGYAIFTNPFSDFVC